MERPHSENLASRLLRFYKKMADGHLISNNERGNATKKKIPANVGKEGCGDDFPRRQFIRAQTFHPTQL